IEPMAQVDDWERVRQRVQLLRPWSLLEAVKARAFHSGQRGKRGQGNELLVVVPTKLGIRIPGDANLATGDSAQFLTPMVQERRVGEQVRHLGGHRGQGGAEQAR